jgi:hypothetical protein
MNMRTINTYGKSDDGTLVIVMMDDINSIINIIPRTYGNMDLANTLRKIDNPELEFTVRKRVDIFNYYVIVRVSDLDAYGFRPFDMTVRSHSAPVINNDAALATRISARLGEHKASELRSSNLETAKASSEAWSRELRRLQEETKKSNNNQVLVQPMFDPWD